MSLSWYFVKLVNFLHNHFDTSGRFVIHIVPSLPQCNRFFFWVDCSLMHHLLRCQMLGAVILIADCLQFGQIHNFCTCKQMISCCLSNLSQCFGAELCGKASSSVLYSVSYLLIVIIQPIISGLPFDMGDFIPFNESQILGTLICLDLDMNSFFWSHLCCLVEKWVLIHGYVCLDFTVLNSSCSLVFTWFAMFLLRAEFIDSKSHHKNYSNHQIFIYFYGCIEDVCITNGSFQVQ